MFATILAWLGNLLGGPFATAAVNAYKAKLDATNSQDAHTADLVGRELAVQQRELELQSQLRIAEIGKWWEPDHLFGYIMVLYFGKVIVWDKVLGSLTHGFTDPITGDVLTWAGWIMAFYFGKRAFENVARILKR
jgi:hypothetical protein